MSASSCNIIAGYC